jgi:hypothetical protein
MHDIAQDGGARRGGGQAVAPEAAVHHTGEMDRPRGMLMNAPPSAVRIALVLSTLPVAFRRARRRTPRSWGTCSARWSWHQLIILCAETVRGWSLDRFVFERDFNSRTCDL